ncbi:hypothetical protein LV89_00979 [Arcicella aurantiaca]|uniref:MoxR-vWA-beta-propeller ternary system domain-containing protein n=1 Tax=Arcicella aurantiaca TaxID=591202 RepID=A0A316EY42_9BACT|nr:hypothetical protein [Arcicella aurantiaca]PWK28200.1 hypothetical protein LV89_00979 [Arcicella aurantiaca]
MKLTIEPYHQNNYPLGGILIQGNQPHKWLSEIQAMGLLLENIIAYPIPATTPNSVWGCFLMVNLEKYKVDIRLNTFVQVINQVLYLPEKTTLYPSLSKHDIDKLFLDKPAILHPAFGLVELSEPINWFELVISPTQKATHCRRPADAVFIPKRISSFQIMPTSVEETLQQLEEKIFPQQKNFEDQPLNVFEKTKLLLYKQLFDKKAKITETESADYQEKPLFSLFKSVLNIFSKKESEITESMKEDFASLEKRNQKYLDKLLEMFQNNLEEALKYAIPLDEGTSRGSNSIRGADFSMRWSNFSLFGNNDSSVGGSTFFDNDGYFKLQKEYAEAAQKLIQQKQYHKAAFIFMKLLKNPFQAAKTLEDGGLYKDAASIYLKYVKDKNKAAICYEKGNMTVDAIELYKELNQNEKVGDLYVSINRQKEGFVYYQKVVDEYKNSYQYVKASLLYKNKMFDVESGQALLLDGWRNQRDAFNCLNNYLNNIHQDSTRWQELVSVYKEDVSPQNHDIFLNVLKYEFERDGEFSEGIRDMAYEVITKQLKTNPSVVSELRTYNKKDKQLVKDTMRYKLNVVK